MKESIPVNKILDFSNKTVLVTGGSKSIGAGIALRFAEAGANLIISYRSDEEGAKNVVAMVQKYGKEAIALQGDSSKRADIENIVDQAINHFGQIDVLINNAGIYPLSPILEMQDEEWDEVMAVNLRGFHIYTQVAAKTMIESGISGSIINISSIEADSPAQGHSHYGASKAGIANYTRTAAAEFGKYGIRINSIAPGLIWREGIEDAWPEGVTRWQNSAPLKRLGQPEDIADACLFLASPAASWITGINLSVDGGILTQQTY